MPHTVIREMRDAWEERRPSASRRQRSAPEREAVGQARGGGPYHFRDSSTAATLPTNPPHAIPKA
jgi:hypothetical protein